MVYVGVDTRRCPNRETGSWCIRPSFAVSDMQACITGLRNRGPIGLGSRIFRDSGSVRGTDSKTLCDLSADVCFEAALSQEMRESAWLNI